MTIREVEESINSLHIYCSFINRCSTINTGLFFKDKLIAFSLNELLSDKWVMGHFGKSLIDYENSMLKMEYENARLLSNHGCALLNIQQDTGLHGLRLAKMSYNPAFFLKKYTITLT